jgi:arylsulfatase
MYQESLSRRAFLNAGAGTLLSASSVRAQPSRPPNFVLIVCDDLGYGDLGSYGSSISTPNLDRMAEEGVQFRQFYAASNVCSPSRAGLLTGCYPTRVGVPNVLWPADTTGLSVSQPTIAEVLKPAGYATMCVGKWHVGTQPQFMPRSRGFDHYYGIPYSSDMSPSILIQDGTIIESTVQLDTLTQRYTQQSVDFIANNKNNPFFLYLAHNLPHLPLAASTAFQGKSALGQYADVVEEIDWSAGQVLQALKASGIDSNTLVMFTSDHGPWYQGSAGKLRGRKWSTYEGGVRVPFIARFPGWIPATSNGNRSAFQRTPETTSGRVSNAMATAMDLLPTIAGLAGASFPNNLDGIDIGSVLSGRVDIIDHDVFLYFDSWDVQCARSGPWKLHISRNNTFPWSPAPAGGGCNLLLPQPELYNVDTDPDESYDTAPLHPDVVAYITASVQNKLPTFPSDVMNAWNTTAGYPIQSTPVDALPALATPQQ